MKCFCWNVRGLNGDTRQIDVPRWIRTNRPSIGGLLETRVKQENLNALMAHSFPEWKFDSNHSTEAENGRIVVIWNPALSVITYLKTPQLVVCGVFDPITSCSFTVAFVYAFNDRMNRLPLWADIKRLASSPVLRNAPWIVLGDFNQVLAVSEAFSLSSPVISLEGMADFHDCLFESELFDLSFGGCFFTWSNKSTTDPKTRKLDRALVNEVWQDTFPASYALFDAPRSSDHSPCLVYITEDAPSRKIRFTYFSFFGSHPDFGQMLESTWIAPYPASTPLYVLYQKLRSVKFLCKSLNRRCFSNIQGRTKEAFENLESIQKRLLTTPSQELFLEEQTARDSWLWLSAAEQNFFKLKSRVRWTGKGDANTGFFHKCVKGNLSRNVILHLVDRDGNRLVSPPDLKAHIIHFYSYLQGRSNVAVTPPSVAQIQAIHPFRCSDSLHPLLTAIPSADVIKDLLFSLPNSKAPGPDGFSAEFFKESWSVVGGDVIAAVRDFFISSYMPRQTNATVLSLIPKVPGASSLSDFRPISLCNTVYKIISKILASRLKIFTEEAVQGNQVGFVKGRVLCENVLLASELVSGFQKPGRTRRGCIQLDISKAFDSIEWEFILNILHAYELPELFIKWIRLCISSPHYSISLNGELLGFIPGKKGLRQGDPISSSLFVMAMDILSKDLDKAVSQEVFKPHPDCYDPLVTHLSFADDVLIFFDGSSDSLRGIMQVLLNFQRKSGLALNLRKTKVFIDGNNVSDCQALATQFGLQQGTLPVKYLGLPLSPKKLSKRDYQPLIDRVRARVSSWTAKHLSFAGRLQLIQSVIFGIINFWSAVFPLPKSCFDQLERLCNAFLWSGGTESARSAKVSWSSVCTGKESGGLGLRRLLGLNQVYGLKLIWLLFSSNGSLWVAWVERNLLQGKSFWSLDLPNSGSWIWKQLLNLRNIVKPLISCQLGNGRKAFFWLDNWAGPGSLLDLVGPTGPLLSGIPELASVSDVVGPFGWLVSRSRNPVLRLMRSYLPPQPPDTNNSSIDLFIWRNSIADPPSNFSVAKTLKALNPDPPSVAWHFLVWFKGRIPKHAFITWTVMWQRLPTRDKLAGWGLNVPTNCLLCGTGTETSDHLFFSCNYSTEVWTSFFSQSSLSPPSVFPDVVDWVRTVTSSKKVKAIIKLIFQACIYFLWRERNSRLHSAMLKPSHVIQREIQLQIRARLLGLDRESYKALATHSASQSSYLTLWFEMFQP